MRDNNKIKRIISYIKTARPHKSLFPLILDIILHKIAINTNPRDYFKYEFYQDKRGFEEKGRYVSTNGSRYFPYGKNPLKYNLIFTNKYVQKAILQHFRLPTPGLITTIGEKKELSDQKQLNSFLDAIEKEDHVGR